MKIDRTNQLYGNLLALRPVGRTKKNGTVWLCRCTVARNGTICGKLIEIDRLGQKTAPKSCGCLAVPMRDITGRRYGTGWIAVRRVNRPSLQIDQWELKHEVCGHTIIRNIKTGKIRPGRCAECRRLRASNKPTPVKHGHSRANNSKPSPTYGSWSNMRHRCQNPKRASYRDYGAAGVRVCDRWQDFRCFLADMGPRPEGTTLGRILDRGDYEPGNAFWMTPPEQLANRWNNYYLPKWESLRATIRKPPMSVGLPSMAIA